MLIKSISHRSMPFGKLIAYMDSNKGKAGEDNLRLFHNLSSINPVDIGSEFEENLAHKKTQNSVHFYHEVMSFSPRTVNTSR